MRRWLVLFVIAGCSGSDSSDGSGDPIVGPGGAYTDDHRCATWSGGEKWCPNADHPNMYACDDKPGDDCVQSSEPTPSKNQEVWCCSFPCVRSGASSDEWCTGAKKDSYICYGDVAEVAKQLGCDESSQSYLICC